MLPSDFAGRGIVRLVFVTVLLAALLFPLPSESAWLPVSSPFGWRTHPIDGQYKFHTGVDLAYPAGTPIPALFDGIVIFAGAYKGYGYAVYLYHGTIKAYTGYAHCRNIIVQPGQLVKQGEIIAYVGNTGYSTGSHLHLEYIIHNGTGWEYADPLILWK